MVRLTVHRPDFYQLFHIPLATKFDSDEIEMFYFLPLKAEIHGFPNVKLDRIINARAIALLI
jgi:hypothetical protein